MFVKDKTAALLTNGSRWPGAGGDLGADLAL